MSPDDYVSTYLNLTAFLSDGSSVRVQIKNYLQSGLGDQSTRAQQAQQALAAKLEGELKKQPADALEIGGYEYSWPSIRRVFMGKGAPDEIQDVLWLAHRYKLVTSSTIQTYCDKNLGVDCGGFVANLWAIGHPVGARVENGWAGFKPRTFWGLDRSKRRMSASDIAIGDAIIFFSHMKGDDTDLASTDPAKGGEAYHIGAVAGVNVVGDKLELTVAESSGAPATSGGNGVNVRTTSGPFKIGKGLVYMDAGVNKQKQAVRLYFVGRAGNAESYGPFGSY